MKGSGRGAEIGSVGVIKSNPDQSKHLETATVRVLGFEVDFVNLRAEEYTDSRIPVMRIGTAEEDALRRDLTINALFYNINERSNPKPSTPNPQPRTLNPTPRPPCLSGQHKA